jgi:glutamyl-tRNA synthetase
MTEKHSSKTVVTRFPPSPTGLLQMGNVRTAIYNYLFARQHGGKFIFRIEDTDKERSKKEYEVELIKNLKWLGIEWDNETFVRQSERSEVYASYIKKMVENGSAYISKETPKEAGQRDEVIRFKNPNKVITFSDMVRDEISFDTTDLGDFVIAKSMTEPVYHLAVVIDDFEAGVTHVIRGEDHISNTPRQILIGDAIGAPRPIFAHLPLILDTDRSKLSKRKHGEKISLKYHIEQGFLPEGIVNYMALLGWNPGGTDEIFTLADLVKIFDISKVQKSGAIYNEEKLRWTNKEHLKKKPIHSLQLEIEKWIKDSETFKNKKWKLTEEFSSKITPIVLDRISVYGDIPTMLENGEFDYFFEAPEYKAEELIWKDDKENKNTVMHLEEATRVLTTAAESNFSNSESVKELLWNYAEKKGKGSVLWPIRFALTGKMKSPDPFTIISILGKEESLARLKKAWELLK